MQWEEFARRAACFDHDLLALERGEELVTHTAVETVAGLRRLAMATDEQRRRRGRVFFSPQIEVRRGLGQGVHDRIEAHALADGVIEQHDLEPAAAHFPFPVRALSVRRKHLGPGEIWDLSVRGDHWGLDYRDDVLSVVNVGELRLAPDAVVVVRGNLLILVVQHLVCEPRDARTPHLAVLPTPFSVDAGHGPFDGQDGMSGNPGSAGSSGLPVRTSPTLLGPRTVGPVIAGTAGGQPGSDGGRGRDGGCGRTGGATKIAEITIRELDGVFTVLAAGGRGGNGGAGGEGGVGGVGGEGAMGQRTIGGVHPPGQGGNGGNGGDGGRGGRGGHGGIGSNIFISLPPQAAARVRIRTEPAAGGEGGRGGRGGSGGVGRRAGADGGTGGTAPDGRPGIPGTDGAPGRDGRARPCPPVFVNERPVQCHEDKSTARRTHGFERSH
ncbi:hypothetical protein [Embleya sp. NBC_00896]|uniref:hypothetical protein n=1 Tax=Embleya sp. NBC_00896 TaxID=2975961 RepID=UPI003863877B|nr:hypothetical protein OG928_46560 [Embleya sp. NBC_00896]